jgi:predicted transcriptional regulator
LADGLVSELDSVADEIQSTRSGVIRRAVEHYLYGPACERDVSLYQQQPLTAGESLLLRGPAN